MDRSDFIFRYRVRNWPVYNRALVRRGSITFRVDEEVVQVWRETAALGPLGGRRRTALLHEWRRSSHKINELSDFARFRNPREFNRLANNATTPSRIVRSTHPDCWRNFSCRTAQ